MNPSKFKVPARHPQKGRNIWKDFLQLSAEYKCVDMGLGCTNEPVPKHINDILVSVVSRNDPVLHQYARGFGHIRLVKALSQFYAKLTGHVYEPLNEFLVTVGASEALYASIQGFIDTGDEVIIIEPYFDSYEPVVRICGGICKFIPLKPKSGGAAGTSLNAADWTLDFNVLASMFSEKTKMIILNTPNNPLGKVFSQRELDSIAALCIKWDVLCVSDEVYEWLVYDDQKHIRMCTLAGMRERTITIGSVGKSFSVTGWKTGWAYAPAKLIERLQPIHQNAIYSCVTVVQEAIAILIENELGKIGTPDSYFLYLQSELRRKRDTAAEMLQKAGMTVTRPNGGFFMLANWSELASGIDLPTTANNVSGKARDYLFAEWLAKTVGLLGIPSSVFYSDDHKFIGEDYVRFCFYKTDDTLERAEKVLKKWRKF